MQKTSKLIVCLFTFVMCVASRGFLKNSCILCWFIQLKAFFLTSCVFWIFYQNAGSQLCFRFFFFFFFLLHKWTYMTISIIYATCCSFNIVVYSTVLHLKKNNKLNKSTQIYICCSQTEVKSDKTLTTSENLDLCTHLVSCTGRQDWKEGRCQHQWRHWPWNSSPCWVWVLSPRGSTWVSGAQWWSMSNRAVLASPACTSCCLHHDLEMGSGWGARTPLQSLTRSLTGWGAPQVLKVVLWRSRLY